MRVQVRGERTVTSLPLILGYSADNRSGGQGGSHQTTTTTIIAVVCKTSLVRACGHIRKQKNSSHGRVVVVSTRGGRVWKEEAAVCQPPDHHRWPAPRQPTSYRKEIVIILITLPNLMLWCRIMSAMWSMPRYTASAPAEQPDKTT